MKTKMLMVLVIAGVFVAPLVEARITRIEITSVESPTFKDPATGVARTFGSVGAYEKLRGKAYGEVDPRDPQNAVITDIELAAKNANGKVPYSIDIYILKPVDLDQGNRKVYMEVNNRGGKLFGSFNLSTGGNNPTTAADESLASLALKLPDLDRQDLRLLHLVVQVPDDLLKLRADLVGDEEQPNSPQAEIGLDPVPELLFLGLGTEELLEDLTRGVARLLAPGVELRPDLLDGPVGDGVRRVFQELAHDLSPDPSVGAALDLD